MGAVTPLFTCKTFKEFERMEDSPLKHELIRGDWIELPPAEIAHGKISHRVFHHPEAAVEEALPRGEAPGFGVEYHGATPLIPGFSLRLATVSGAY